MSEDVSLKELFTELRKDDKEALKIALEASSKAVDKAEEAQLRVNVSQNEFRGTLKDQAATLMPRKETEQLVVGLQKELDSVKRLVYIGLGMILMLQFLFTFLVE